MLAAFSLTVSCRPHFCVIVFTEVAIGVLQVPWSYNCFKSATNMLERLWQIDSLADICVGWKNSETAFSTLHLKVVSKHHSTKARSPPLPYSQLFTPLILLHDSKEISPNQQYKGLRPWTSTTAVIWLGQSNVLWFRGWNEQLRLHGATGTLTPESGESSYWWIQYHLSYQTSVLAADSLWTAFSFYLTLYLALYCFLKSIKTSSKIGREM